MILFPAIDLYEGKAVRLTRGDYAQMTVYSNDPTEIGRDFVSQGASYAHLVDLEGARDGTTPNLKTALRIRNENALFCELGGGIRRMETVERCLGEGMDRVILGTAAVTDPSFLEACVTRFGEQIAVGVDIRDGYVAIRGWKEKTRETFREFCRKMADIGVRTLIVTDISRDGMMNGTNRDLYRELRESFPDLRLTASGGVSTLEDIQALRDMDLYGAILGRAYYTGSVKLSEAIEVAG